MKPVTPEPTRDLMREPRLGPPAADVDAGNVQRAAFALDSQLGLIVEANAEGWALWGLDAASAVPPVAVDHAMPALRQLSAMSSVVRVVPTQEILTFWTPNGLRQLRCAVRRPEANRHLFAVEVMADAAVAPHAPFSAVDQTPCREDASRRLAHELRTPLSAVIAYAEVLKDEHFGPFGSSRYQGYARNIYDSARHALGVVDGMLGNSKSPQSTVPELVFADLDPRVVVEDCIAVARPLADKAGLELACDGGSRVPRIVADEVSLKQMLLNLLTNAIKFARRGDRVTVGVTYELGGQLRIAVADTGPGMREPPLALEGGRAATRARINTGVDGHGIGLPLTQALAEANGAALVIDSAPGRGTRVTIAFAKDRVVPV